MAAGAGLWTFRDHFIRSSAIEILEKRPIEPVAPKPNPSLFMTKKESMAGLFDLAEESISSHNRDGGIQMSLVSFPWQPSTSPC